MVPLIGTISAGEWQLAVSNPDAWVPVVDRVGGPRCFALRPKGDSMNQLADEDSYIVIDPDQNTLENGRIYAVRNESGEALFKRFLLDPPRLEPMSTNEEHSAIPLGQEPFTVIGRVTYVGRQL
jgi:SOS-response transcriptional repressor LexA